jgi:hypothetical protein
MLVLRQSGVIEAEVLRAMPGTFSLRSIEGVDHHNSLSRLELTFALPLLPDPDW